MPVGAIIECFLFFYFKILPSIFHILFTFLLLNLLRKEWMIVGLIIRFSASSKYIMNLGDKSNLLFFERNVSGISLDNCILEIELYHFIMKVEN